MIATGHTRRPYVLAFSLVAALLSITAPALAEDDAGDDLAPANSDSMLVVDEPVPVEPPPGGDLRLVAASGIDAALAAPGIRSVGSGWDGHRVSYARGALPSALTEVTLRGRWTADWIDEGLDLLAVTSPAPGVIVTPSGPDLSIWPVVAAEWPGVRRGGAAPLTVDLAPLRRPAVPPFSRLTAATGPYGRSLLGAEFSRAFSGGSAVTGFFEAEEGRAPAPGGSYGIDRVGGAALVDLDGAWTAELGGVRVALDRSRPTPDPAVGARVRESVRTDLFVRGFTERIRMELFHTRTWLESGAPGSEARSEIDGIHAGLSEAGPLAAMRVQIERRAVSGTLLSEGQSALSLRAEVADTVRVGPWALSVVAGAHLLGNDFLPRASVALVGEERRPAFWSVEASLWGRHPTALELSLVPTSLPGTAGTIGQVVGSRLVGPERAAAVTATYQRSDVLSGVGVCGELIRVIDPVVLMETGSSLYEPGNASDETGGVLSVWAAAGDTTGPSGGFDVSLLAVDPDGALNALAPVPLVSAGLSASVPIGIFEDYVQALITAAVEYESGLSRGPWSGLVDDSRSSLSLLATASVGSARLFISLDDVLSSDTARVPGMEPGGATLAAGFSWRFRD